MKRLIRLILILVFLAAMLPIQAASAAKAPTECELLAAQLDAKVMEGQSEAGAKYCFIFPKQKWNRDVVVFAHGYVDARQPIDIAWDQIVTPNFNLAKMVLDMHYGFATTSYSKNGLAVLQGVQDVLDLVQIIRGKNPRIERVFLTGASEGGLVTTLALEQNPNVFAAGLATCGPIGDFQMQVDYWARFRMAFDSFFPHALLYPQLPGGIPVPYPGSSPIYIAPEAVSQWESVVSGVVASWLQYDPTSAMYLIGATGVPIDPDPAKQVESAGASILGLLYYNVEATNDGRMTLVPGLTMDQLATTNLGSPVNLPPPYQPDLAAQAAIQAHYQTSGFLQRPLVVMHTTLDPIVPFAHMNAYALKSAMVGSPVQPITIPVTAYGHCAFTEGDLLTAFSAMVLSASQ